ARRRARLPVGDDSPRAGRDARRSRRGRRGAARRGGLRDGDVPASRLPRRGARRRAPGRRARSRRRGGMNVDVQDRLGAALACFLKAYEARPELVAEQRGWSPIIALAASDAAARVVVSLDDGRVARLGGAPAPATLQITGDLDTLCDVLMLKR